MRSRPIAALAAAAACAAPAAPAQAQLSGSELRCTLQVEVRQSPTGYTLDGRGAPCQPVVWNTTVLAERATLKATGAPFMDGCGTGTTTGLLTVTTLHRGSAVDVPYTATWAGGAVVIEGRLGMRRVRATAGLLPRNGTCLSRGVSELFGAGGLTMEHMFGNPTP